MPRPLLCDDLVTIPQAVDDTFAKRAKGPRTDTPELPATMTVVSSSSHSSVAKKLSHIALS